MKHKRQDGIGQALGHAISDKRLEVLRRIGESGSISQAAREAGISYKAAWQAIDTLSSLSGVALVERTVGGSGGGGARLTQEGTRLLALSDELAKARQTVLARFARSGQSPSPAGDGLGVRTSMRNQIPVVVESVSAAGRGDLAAQVLMRSEGGHSLTSSITRESADLLGLRRDLPVLLLCKATAVLVTPEAPAPQAGRCQMPGKVLRIARGRERDEVTLVLPGGATWVGFAEHPFGRRKGQSAFASMPDSALVIALPTH
ncbi:TOBE domain-containing protein [Hydrogenophaga sp.]|uniref:TOBE domain-containing protein n=1 Tax=Hydrogenophaga sp. TaxID=1904254 RepID=UPI0035B34AF8